MNSYGNTSWEIFVYGTYGIVAFLLFIYVIFSLYTRNKSLKSLVEEGFLEEQGVNNEKKN